MKYRTVILGVLVFAALFSAHGAPLRLGMGVSYLYPAGRLGAGVNGGAEAEVSLTTRILPRVDLGVDFAYATVRGKENEHLRVVLSPLELVTRVRVMELTEFSAIDLDAGVGVIGIYRTVDRGKEGAILGGEGVVSFGVGASIPFGAEALHLKVMYHRILDPVERANLFSLGGLILWD